MRRWLSILLALLSGSAVANVPRQSFPHNLTCATACGNIVARYLYDPYGNLLSSSGALADANTYRFSSKEIHANSGLYYYGFRYYEPNLQRWLNRDPIGVAGGMNLHGFVGNDPMNTLDFLGLDPHLPASGQNGIWTCGTPGNGEYFHNRLFKKYGKTVPYFNGQPNLSSFAEGQVVDVPKDFRFTGSKTDNDIAEAEMLKRDTNWKKRKGWQWHHFTDPTGQRQMQYVPADINLGLKHKNPEVADARAAKRASNEAAQELLDCHKNGKAKLVGAIAALGLLSQVASFAGTHSQEYTELNKNIPAYFGALQRGEPTDEYSSNIALAYSNIFDGNTLHYAAMFAALENR